VKFSTCGVTLSFKKFQILEHFKFPSQIRDAQLVLKTQRTCYWRCHAKGSHRRSSVLGLRKIGEGTRKKGRTEHSNRSLDPFPFPW
jgi:hypothetical protein